MHVEFFFIVCLLVLILWELSKINSRLKERFPTEEEQDYQWSQKDLMGHALAHTGRRSEKEK